MKQEGEAPAAPILQPTCRWSSVSWFVVGCASVLICQVSPWLLCSNPIMVFASSKNRADVGRDLSPFNDGSALFLKCVDGPCPGG